MENDEFELVGLMCFHQAGEECCPDETIMSEYANSVHVDCRFVLHYLVWMKSVERIDGRSCQWTAPIYAFPFGYAE